VDEAAMLDTILGDKQTSIISENLSKLELQMIRRSLLL